MVVLADSGFAGLTLLGRCRRLARPITMITRMWLDVDLYEPVLPRRPGMVSQPRLKSKRLPTLARRLGDPQSR